MSDQIFINLPVRDLDKSMAFFAALGYAHNPQFTDQNAACIVLSEHNYVMLLTEPFFQGFTTKPVSDRASAGAIFALSCDRRDEVDARMAKALAAGAREHGEARDYGFMYQRGFEDLDGHLWEVFHMDMAALPAQ